MRRTLEEIGKHLGLTKPRIKQIEQQAIKKFRYHWSVMYPDTPCPIIEEDDRVDDSIYFDSE